MYLIMSGREAKDSVVNAMKAVTLMSISIPKEKDIMLILTKWVLPDGVNSKGNKEM